MAYLVISHNGTKKTYGLQGNEPAKPYLKIGTNGYLPLTTKTSAGLQVNINGSGQTYRVVSTGTVQKTTESSAKAGYASVPLTKDIQIYSGYTQSHATATETYSTLSCSQKSESTSLPIAFYLHESHTKSVSKNFTFTLGFTVQTSGVYALNKGLVDIGTAGRNFSFTWANKTSTTASFTRTRNNSAGRTSGTVTGNQVSMKLSDDWVFTTVSSLMKAKSIAGTSCYRTINMLLDGNVSKWTGPQSTVTPYFFSITSYLSKQDTNSTIYTGTFRRWGSMRTDLTYITSGYPRLSMYHTRDFTLSAASGSRGYSTLTATYTQWLHTSSFYTKRTTISTLSATTNKTTTSTLTFSNITNYTPSVQYFRNSDGFITGKYYSATTGSITSPKYSISKSTTKWTGTYSVTTSY